MKPGEAKKLLEQDKIIVRALPLDTWYERNPAVVVRIREFTGEYGLYRENSFNPFAYVPADYELQVAWLDLSEHIKYLMRQVDFPGAHSFDFFEDGRIARITWEIGMDTYQYYPDHRLSLEQIIAEAKTRCRSPHKADLATWKEPDLVEQIRASLNPLFTQPYYVKISNDHTGISIEWLWYDGIVEQTYYHKFKDLPEAIAYFTTYPEPERNTKK